MQGNRTSYFKGKRMYKDGGQRVSNKRNITWKEFLSLTEMYSNQTDVLTRDRVVCVYSHG